MSVSFINFTESTNTMHYFILVTLVFAYAYNKQCELAYDACLDGYKPLKISFIGELKGVEG